MNAFAIAVCGLLAGLILAGAAVFVLQLLRAVTNLQRTVEAAATELKRLSETVPKLDAPAMDKAFRTLGENLPHLLKVVRSLNNTGVEFCKAVMAKPAAAETPGEPEPEPDAQSGFFAYNEAEAAQREAALQTRAGITVANDPSSFVHSPPVEQQ